MPKFSAKVNLLTADNSKTKAFATLSVEIAPGVNLAIDGFSVVEGRDGPFVSFPQGKPYEKDGKTVYPRTTRVLEQRDGAKPGAVEAEIVETILAAYGDALGTPRAASAAANAAAEPARPARPSNPRTTPASW